MKSSHPTDGNGNLGLFCEKCAILIKIPDAYVRHMNKAHNENLSVNEKLYNRLKCA
jgi:uncharacterized C2H2 Zn-finger protein